MALCATVLTGLTGAFSPACADDDFTLLQNHAQTHCILFQREPLNPAPSLGQREQDIEISPSATSLTTQYEYAPDMGFLLPVSWPVMGWEQRVRFNHAMTALIKRRMDIPQEDAHGDDCEPQIRIVEHPQQDDPEEQTLPSPNPPRLQAIVLMAMHDAEGNRVPLTYLYGKRWNTGWELEDIVIHTTSVYDKDSQKLEEIIRTSGISQLAAYLDQLLNMDDFPE